MIHLIKRLRNIESAYVNRRTIVYIIINNRSLSIVTVAVSVAVCQIFSVKEWRDLDSKVRGRSRSLKMAPFDRPHATFYWSGIVNIALSCTIFELFDVDILTLKLGLEVTQGH